MANNLGVSLEKLQETVEILREQKLCMNSKLSNISSSVSNLRSSWDSPASQELQGIAAKMEDRFQELEKDVDSFAQFLDGVIRNYNATENVATDIMGDILSQFK